MSLLNKRSSRRSVSGRVDADPNDRSYMTFRGGRAPGPNDVFIAVMGVTGSGKSSFISLCSGKVVKIGHHLGACTSTVDVYAYEISPRQTVYLIDTPGFDDTNRSDTAILREIASWLGDSYRNNILLNGIIYLHRITDIRMQGSAKKNLIMFKQLCGQDALKKVILVTTMWDKVPTNEAEAREKELIDTPEFWGWMVSKGSSCHRHHNTESSARNIVSKLAAHKTPIATDLQRQLVDEHKSLDQTSAGRELQSEMLKEKEKWARERKEIEEQMKAAIKQRDREAEEMMREERDRYTKMIKKVESDTGALRSTMNNLLAERDKRVERMEQQMREQQAAHEAELKKISERQKRVEKEKAELEKQQRRREKEEEKRRQREREKLDEQRRRREDQEEKEEQQRRSQALTQAPKTSTYSGSTKFAPYSVTITSGKYFCVSQKHFCSNDDNPAQKEGSSWIRAVSLGDHCRTGGRHWIAGYSDGRWWADKGIAQGYPNLSAYLNERGQNNLEMCTLGPDGSYYARWRDGRWMSWASEEINNAISNAHKDGRQVKAIAFGYNNSYIISYGHKSTTNWKGLGTSWNLKGQYPSLSVDKYLRGTSIAAVTLDMDNGTDYMIVYRVDNSSDTRIWFAKSLSHENIVSTIDNWWENA